MNYARIFSVTVSISMSFVSLSLIAPTAFAKGDVYLLGITGGSASGKTTLAQQITKMLKEDPNSGLKPEEIELLSLDNYYDPEKQPQKDYVNGQINYDHPSAIDLDLAYQHLVELQNGNAVDVPRYFFDGKKSSQTQRIGPLKVVVFEGIHALHLEKIRKILDHKVFVDFPAPMRIQRRVSRDIETRGYTEPVVRQMISDFVKPMHDLYIEPMRHEANEIILGNSKDGAAEQLMKRIYRTRAAWQREFGAQAEIKIPRKDSDLKEKF